jgi:hypothetical protein
VSEVVIEAVQHHGVHVTDPQTSDVRPDVRVEDGPIAGQRGDRAVMSLEMDLDELGQRHIGVRGRPSAERRRRLADGRASAVCASDRRPRKVALRYCFLPVTASRPTNTRNSHTQG